MPKQFYSERDIEELFHQGVHSLELNDQVVLTELAYEKAKTLGMKLVSSQPDQHPSDPVRPYVTRPDLQKNAPPKAAAAPTQPAAAKPAQPAPAPVATYKAPAPTQTVSNGTGKGSSDLSQNIRSAVIAKLGDQVDAALLDTIISRVLTSTGLK